MLLEIPARQAPWIAEGQAAHVHLRDLPGRDTLTGRVQTVERSYHRRLGIPPYHDRRDRSAARPSRRHDRRRPHHDTDGRAEPFCSLPADPPRFRAGEPRIVYACPDHPDDLAIDAGRCPIDRKPREARPLSEFQRLRWWCPMHPERDGRPAGESLRSLRRHGSEATRDLVRAGGPGADAFLVRRSLTPAAQGRLRRDHAGMFDGVEVVLGPRCGDAYPVVRGLEAGQRVAFAGAFLLDAETRLNPSSRGRLLRRGPGRTSGCHRRRRECEQAAASAAKFQDLAPEDRPLAERQKLCPVTSKPLGSMGTPARIVVSGQVVFLCCDGCEGASSENRPNTWRSSGPLIIVARA